MARKASCIVLHQKTQFVLEKITRQQKATQAMVKRALIILGRAGKQENQSIAQNIGVDSDTVTLWQKRWVKESPRLDVALATNCKDSKLEEIILNILSDKYRSGAPPVFTPEQVTQIVALACVPPRDCDVELSHWTPSALMREVVKRKIVDSISAASVGRFLKRGGLKTPS